MAKKNTYTKLDALGSESRYSVRFYAATGTGKYETVGTETRKYDPEVWTLYHGVQPGIETNDVYKGNTRTLWKTLRAPAILMTLALLVGVFFLARFFVSDDAVGEGSAVKKVVEQQKAAVPSIDRAPGSQPATVVTKAPVTAAAAAKPKQPAGVEYVLKVAETARARHAGWYGARDIVEFRSIGGGQVVDRFTTEQLWALGWSVKRTAFGVILSAKGNEIIATSWPVDSFGEQSAQTTERIRAAGSPVTSASETQPIIAASTGDTVIAVGARPMGTFPESVQNRYSGG